MPDRDPVVIDLSDTVDRWQWRCPRGHTRWEPTNYHWWCASCAHGYDPDAEPEFEYLVNERTGEHLQRSDVVLMTETGPMHDPALAD